MKRNRRAACSPEQVFEAASSGNLAALKKHLASDAELVNAQIRYEQPIHAAVRKGHADVVAYLLEQGADPGQSVFLCKSWDYLLRVAEERRHQQVARLLTRELKRRFRFHPEFENLKVALLNRKLRGVRAILKRNPRLALAADALGQNAIHLSVASRNLGLMKLFAQSGTPVDKPRADGRTPILLAMYWYHQRHPTKSIRNRWVLVGDLLARGAAYTMSVAAAVGDLEQIERLRKKTPELVGAADSAHGRPLSYAAREGHLDTVRLLLDYGADPNVAEPGAPDGLALYNACCGNHVDVAKLLLERGANPNAGLDSCECCLTICEVYHGDRAKPLQRLLRAHGAYLPPYRMSGAQLRRAIQNRDPAMQHPEFLGNVMKQRSTKLVSIYLDADPSVPNRMDYWQSVICPPSPKIARLLLARGLDPHLADWQGKTLLHACAENGDVHVATILLDAGADIHARESEFEGTPLASAVRQRDGKHSTESSAKKRRQEMVQLLLDRGALPSHADDPPWATPLAWARRLKLTDIESILLAHQRRS